MKKGMKKRGWIVFASAVAVLAIFIFMILINYRHSIYLQSAVEGGDYLVRMTKPDGRYVYRYDPERDEELDGYNILRHAGTTYSLLELYEATGNEIYLRTADRALRYLIKHVVTCPDREEYRCVQERNEIKLGGNGLGLLAFSKYVELTGDEEMLMEAQRLAGWIKATQNEEGEFPIHKMNLLGEASDFTSGYYPGEAIFALTRLYELDQNEEWMDVAHKGALWLIEVRDGEKTINELEHDHWLLYGLNELYQHQEDERYVEHAEKIVEAISASQHRGLIGEKANWNGGFYDPPRSTPTATRSEGLIASYKLFTQAQRTDLAERAFSVLEDAIAFELSTQVTPVSRQRLSLSSRSLGGFYKGIGAYEIRIDYVQHNISALLGYDSILEERG